MTQYPVSVLGDELGLPFPTTIEPLLEQGIDFLTTAFRACGALSEDNRVTAITASKEFFGGGMGRKLLLSVSYERNEPGLHTDLFVKFPREFGDPLREVFGPLMEPEVRFALLSRREGFPIPVPKCYFADFNKDTISGIIITERIAYGEGVIEPCHDKCVDYEVEDQLGHYSALTKAMARLAAHHKSGKFGPDIESQFPFDPRKIDVGVRIPYTPEQLDIKLDKLASFAASHPQLFQHSTGKPEFLVRFAQEARLVLEHEVAIHAYLNRNRDFIALCHWNMNLDNAWFWRDQGGELQAGLLDWGSVGQMNVATAFCGMICSAEADFLNTRRGELINLFVEEYRHQGGPAIDVCEFSLMIKLSMAFMGIAWILDAPSLIEKEVPNVHLAKDRFDPMLKDNFLARAQLQILNVFLNEWQDFEIGTALIDFLASNKS